MSIKEIEPGKYKIRFTFMGKQIKRVFEGTAKEAQREEIRIKKEIAKTPVAPKQEPTLIELAKRMSEVWHDLKQTELSRKLILTMQEFEAAGMTYLKDLTTLKIQQMYDKWLKREAVATANQRLSLVRTMVRQAVRHWGVAATAPIWPKMTAAPTKVVWLTKEQETACIAYLLDEGREQEAQFISVLVDTGMRRDECLSLTAAQVNLAEACIHLVKTKNDKPRTIPMTKRVTEIMRARLAGRNPNDRLWSFSGQHFGDHWRRARIQAGIHDDKYSLHCLRHTFASRLVQKGIDLYTVKELMGHTTIRTTEIYAHLDTRSTRKAISALE